MTEEISTTNNSSYFLFMPNSYRTNALAVGNFEQICGANLNYDDFVDLDRLIALICAVSRGLKSNNIIFNKIAIGVAYGKTYGATIGNSGKNAVVKLIDSNRQVAHTGAIIVNFKLTKTITEIILNRKTLEDSRRKPSIIVCPAISKNGRKLLDKAGIKCLLNQHLQISDELTKPVDSGELRSIRGGSLFKKDLLPLYDLDDFNIKILGPKKIQEVSDMMLAWAVGSLSNNLSVCLVKNQTLIGISHEQQSGADACEQAVTKALYADSDINGAIAYCSKLFDIKDGMDVLAGTKIKAVQINESKNKDQRVLEYLRANGITVYLLPDK